MEYFDVLDDNGQKTGEIVEREKAHREGVLHRVVHVWIMNTRNELLLQKRSKGKDWMPDKWYVSMGGHLASGEDSSAAIVREFAEELQFDIRPHMDRLMYLHTFREKSVTRGGTFIDDEFYDVYLLRCDVDLDALTLQEEEVQAVAYKPYSDFRQAITQCAPDYVQHETGYPLLLAQLDQTVGWKEGL